MTRRGDFAERFGPLLSWAWRVDAANRILGEADQVIVGWLSGAECALLERVAVQTRAMIAAERAEHDEEAFRCAEAAGRAHEVLRGALRLRLRLPEAVDPVVFPFCRSWVYMPRVMAEAAGVPYLERERLTDVHDDTQDNKDTPQDG